MNPHASFSRSSVIAAAMDWLQSIFVGDVATAIAVVAVAGFGLLLLTGRLPKRRGVQLIVGCFIIFGAPSIAAGILMALNIDSDPRVVEPVNSPPTAIVAAAPPPQSPAVPYDPYAGAALPPRR